LTGVWCALRVAVGREQGKHNCNCGSAHFVTPVQVCLVCRVVDRSGSAPHSGSASQQTCYPARPTTRSGVIAVFDATLSKAD
jgi:hypothetical protein